MNFAAFKKIITDYKTGKINRSTFCERWKAEQIKQKIGAA